MELQSKQLPGLAVFSVDDGKKLGQVKDYVLDPEIRAIVAFIIGGTKRFREEFILPYERIKGIGKEAITVESANVLGKKQDFPQLASLLKAMPDISGRSVMTERGVFLGKAADFTIDSETGTIHRLILKNGMFDDLLRGKHELPIEDITVFGADVILTAEGIVPRPRSNREEKPPQKTPAEPQQPPTPQSTIKQKIPSFKGTRRTLKVKTEAWKKKGYGAKIAALSRRDQKVCPEIIPETDQKPQQPPEKAVVTEKKTASAPEQSSNRAKAGITYKQ